MLWFIEWYREKFEKDLFEKDAITNFKQNKKSIEIKLSGQKNSSSVLRQSNRYQKNRNKNNRSITENISDNRRNNNDQNIAVYSTLTNVSTKIKVVDKATNQVISETRRVDIDTSIRILNGEHQYYSDTSDNSVIDVNQNGNGGSDCDLLSKSTDLRLYCQTKSTVGTTKFKLNEPFISEIEPAFEKLSIIHSEWLTNHSDTNFHHKLFPNRTRKLKNLETHRSSIVKSDLNPRKRITSQYRTFNEHQFYDWVIVSIELKPITSCESSSDDDHISYLNETGSSEQYYSTCEYSDIDIKPRVTLHRCPSIYSSNNTDSNGRTKTDRVLWNFLLKLSRITTFALVFWNF